VTQSATVQVPHDRTSGEAEWALLVGDDVDDLLLTVACDHTDRDLEVHGVTWSKQSAPNILGDVAWSLADAADTFDYFTLRAWVTYDTGERLIQEGVAGQLLPPGYWVEKLAENSLLRPGTVLLGGTIPMVAGVRQFAEAWRVEMSDPTGRTNRIQYRLEQLPQPWD
jgi:2-keto-4-pentenoate hydratase/2-oxohepta-3-ene-1,7-dioic acid hydratase in catechol pathway